MRPGEPISQVRPGLDDLRNFAWPAAILLAAAAAANADAVLDVDVEVFVLPVPTEGPFSQSETRPEPPVEPPFVTLPPPLPVDVFPPLAVSLSESLLCILW